MLPSDPFARPESRHTMHPLLKRILVHGVLVAVLLGAMGYGLTELAKIWLIAQTPARTDPSAPPAAAATAAGYGLDGPRVPLLMAAWGVIFVVVGELVLWAARGQKPAAPAAPPAPPGPDPAELLMDQLIREAEAKMAAAAPTPSPPAPDNTPARAAG